MGDNHDADGALVADFVFIRRQRLNDWALFDDDPRTGYYSTEGFHWPAVIRMILGQAIFFSLLESFGWRITWLTPSPLR